MGKRDAFREEGAAERRNAKGLKYSLNQEEYLKVFLTDGEVPIDDSASERALRNFTIGRKNWVTVNTVRGAQASAVIYSINGDGACERAECLLLPQASADGTAAVAAVPEKSWRNLCWSRSFRGQKHCRKNAIVNAADKRRFHNTGRRI